MRVVKVKKVDVIWMTTWGILNRTNNMTRSCFFFFSLYMYHSYIFFKRKHNCNNRQRAKRIQQKIYRNVEDKSLPIVSDYVLPIRQSSLFSFFFFQLVLKLYPYLVFPFTIKGWELPCFFSSFTEEQKSLLFVFNMDIQILNKYVFRRN